MVSATGTFVPVCVPKGTTAFTWYKPTNPGVRPAKLTAADWPPTVNCGVPTVLDNCCGGAPSVALGFTSPRPVQYSTIVSPG